MSLSKLRAQIHLDSLSSLTDDSLLIILRFVSVPQLLALLSVSRRLHYLILQHTLPHYRTILMYNQMNHSGHLKRAFFFSRRFYAQTHFLNTICRHLLPKRALRPGELHPTGLHFFPPNLPHALPRLQSFTFSYFFSDELVRSQRDVNRLLTGYFDSNWSQTLVSLELYLILDTLNLRSPSDELFLVQLNQLSSLRHLSLHFWALWEHFPDRILPDSMPVLGHLLTFKLHRYPARNTGTLLHQLGPNLTCLTLYSVVCSEQDFLSFLSSKPTYRHTLRTLEIDLIDERDGWPTPLPVTPRVSTLANYGLPLERLLSKSFMIAVRFRIAHCCLSLTIFPISIPRTNSFQVSTFSLAPSLAFKRWAIFR